MVKLQSKIQPFLGLFRLTSFDKSSADGRSKERLRRMALTSASAVASRAVSMIGPLITVPYAVHYLGNERYGLWMAVTSMVAMFAFADLGLGNGLMTQVSQAAGRDDTKQCRGYISSAFFALSGVAGLLLCIYIILFPFIPWRRVLNTSSPELLRESSAVFTVCVLTFLLNLPCGVVQRAQSGLQEGFRSNIWQGIGSVINMAAILLLVKAHASLTVLVLCVTGVAPLISLLNGCQFFLMQRRDLCPRLKDFHFVEARRLLGTGFWFFLVSILLALGLYSDNLIVAHFAGLAKVPLYSVPASIATYLTAIASMLNTPLWGANGEALARGDVMWVLRTRARIVKISSLLTGSAGLLFVILGPILLHWWIGPGFSPGRFLLAGLAAWALLVSIMGPQFMILNGANVVRFQALMFFVFTSVAIPLKIYLLHVFGLPGVVWGSVITYSCLVVPTVLVTVKKVLQRASQLTVAQPALESKQAPLLAAAVKAS